MLQKLVKLIARRGEKVTAQKKRTKAQAADDYEKLESRAVLSTFLVQNLADQGTGSLRDAIEQANSKPGPDLIRFQRGLQGTIALTSGQLEVNDALRIQGPGESSLTISGNSLSRVFKVNTKVGEVYFRGFTIADGLAQMQEEVGFIPAVRGGGILSISSQLRLQDITFRNNRADDRGNDWSVEVVGGGAVASTEYASLNVSRCTFVDNFAAGGSRYAFGGAIASFTFSKAIIQKSVFSGNQVIGGDVNCGGAIATFAGSSSQIVHSEFVGNRAVGQGRQSAFGGALAVRPGAFFDSNCELVVSDCCFRDNTTQATVEAIAGGGAISSYRSSFSVQRSELLANSATGGFVWGGGIHNDQSVGIIRDSQLKSNRAVGLHNEIGKSFSHGGGVACTGGASLTISRSELVLNEARGVRALGGGIFNGAFPNETTKALLTVDRSSLSQNRVETTLASSESLALGGGIFNGNPNETQTSNAIVTATRTKIEKNSALAVTGGQGIGGGVYSVGKFSVDRRLQQQLLDGLAANFATTSSDNVFGQLTVT